MLHKDVVAGDSHVIQQWEVADATARLALSVVATDVGKICLQLDTMAFYALSDNSPMAWVPLIALTVDAVNRYTKNQSVSVVSLTSGTNVATDASLSNNFQLTLGHNATLDNPTNLTAGMVLNFFIDQDGAGGRTLAYGNLFKWPSGTAPTLTTTASAKNLISCVYDGTVLRCSGLAGYA